MSETRLYKYLDFNGGLAMLEHHNLQFTNVTKFNDPFDCHPALFDYSHPPVKKNNWPPADFLVSKGKNDMENYRNSIWVCCLSKVYDSLLMWAYYTNHKGICIGLNKDKILKCCQYKYLGLTFPHYGEVKYTNINTKPNYFSPFPSKFNMLLTKAKEWEHEQEIRLITQDPSWVHVGRTIPEELEQDEVVDWKEIRYYPPISYDCFELLYIGVNMHQRNKDKIIEVAQKLNPNIKIYQMTIDPKAFRLKAESITKE